MELHSREQNYLTNTDRIDPRALNAGTVNRFGTPGRGCDMHHGEMVDNSRSRIENHATENSNWQCKSIEGKSKN